MFGLQPLHLIVILAIALIIFGPQRLPEMGRAIGQSIRQFREATDGTEREVRQALEAKPLPRPQAPLVSEVRTQAAATSAPEPEVQASSEPTA